MARRPCRAVPLWRGVFVVLAIWLLAHTVWGYRRRPVGRLTTEIIENGSGVGGRWHIPPAWLQQLESDGHPCKELTSHSSILDAADCALSFAVHEKGYLNNSHIPLIIHQTWRNLEPQTWNDVIRECIEDWLCAADGKEGPEMAYFLWDDDGIASLVEQYEPELHANFQRLPYPVEKADFFRVAVLKWFGGIYADVDAKPLKHPFGWVYESDLTPWIDGSSGTELKMHTPHVQTQSTSSHAPISYGISKVPDDMENTRLPTVNAIFGIGADNAPDPDPTYWRMGYTYPIQTENWAFCMAPHHPVANQFLITFNETVLRESNNLPSIDPLDITGPPALTAAVMAVAQREDPDLSFNALSGRNDPVGGRGKVVAGDALILPITGFSPGRGYFQNMGSQGVNHRNARLRHYAKGSWRKKDVKVHYGKFCRVAFGMCRDWKKIPDP